VSAAVKLFNAAAAEGDPEAMLWMGKMSLTGDGMVKSVANAKKWLTKAAIRGNKDAEALLHQPPFI
jgi:TPR repeat protein